LVEEKVQTIKKEIPKEKSLPETPSKTVAPPKPAPRMRTGKRRTSALSLKSLTEKVEAVEITPETEIDRDTLPKTPFSEGKLVNLWSEYAQQLIKRGDKSLASILLASKPTLSEFHIQYTLPNQLMAEQLERLRPRLLKYLRDSLNNFSVDLTVKIEVSEVKKFVYTPQEKYEKLQELNPTIDLLRNLFGLDI